MKELHFSRIGFILAAAGSAVGLGNIWKFPYITGEYGGGAFVLVYLVTVLFIGMPLLIGEMTVGSMARKEPVTAFEHLAPTGKEKWRYAGFQFLGGFVILTFYAVVIGWIFYYIYLSFTNLPANVQEAETLFLGMLKADPATQLFFHTAALFLIGYIVSKGVKGGIEKVNLVLMPVLFLTILFMFFYAVGKPAFADAAAFMFKADFSKLTSEAILVAVGNAFFTLSLGMGAIVTYASFTAKNTNLLTSSLWVLVLDTAIALLAGLMMFTFLFDQGMGAAKGPGLVFISMPAVFYNLGPVGHLFAVLFFIALAFAGLTSAISILEPTVAHLHQRLGWSRNKAVWVPTTFAYLVGVVALLSNVEGYEFLKIGERNVFDFADYLSSAVMLPLGGLLLALFLGHVVDRHRLEEYLGKQGLSGKLFALWLFSLKYIVPVGVVLVMLNEIGVF